MGIFRNFPYSNFHELNMDEIIKSIKTLTTEFEKLRSDFDKSINDMFKYIKEYLDNIQIPHNTSQLVNDSGFITIADVPTKTSELNNDSGFITSADLPTVNNGKLTIKRNGTNVAEFTANQSTDVTADITVPTVSNGKLTIQRNGTTVKTFTANQSSNVTANISVPVNVSDLVNDSGFIDGKPTVTPVANAVPSVITGANFNGGYYAMGNIVIIQISGTVSGTFASNDYWTIANGLPTSTTPIALNITSEDNVVCNAEAVKNTNGALVVKSGSVALSGKTIIISGMYIKN